jgi:carboxylesterase type B
VREHSLAQPLDATAFQATCIQKVKINSTDGKQQGMWPSINASVTSEDCLFLNVFAPVLNSTSRDGGFPVVVYFHAGEFRAGSANDQENNAPFSSDTVLVTVNSRLGAFGYLASDKLRLRSSDNSTGNYGLQDQRESLRWIHDNIHAFGGDANNVLIMGESSGILANVLIHYYVCI